MTQTNRKITDFVQESFGFNTLTSERIGYYVYCLIDSRNREIFYIGKGVGNRVFNHELEKLEKAKNQRIKNIKESGGSIEKRVIWHGMNSKESFDMESAIIQLLNSNQWNGRKLDNLVCGHHSEMGFKSVTELNESLGAKKLEDNDIKHNAIIININSTFCETTNKNDADSKRLIYEKTRGNWVISKSKINILELALSEYRGVIRGVFGNLKWENIEDCGKIRKRFIGDDVSNDPRYKQYIGKSVSHLKKKGAANPIRYLSPIA